jgi:hypothetical protein
LDQRYVVEQQTRGEVASKTVTALVSDRVEEESDENCDDKLEI